MKGWNKSVNRGTTGARKKQTAACDRSVSKVKQKAGPAAKASSLGFGGNKIIEVGHRQGR